MGRPRKNTVEEATTKKAPKTEVLRISKPNFQWIKVVIGNFDGAPGLMVNRAKALPPKEAVGTRLGTPSPKEILTPEEHCERALYYMPEDWKGKSKYGLPIGGFKTGMVTAGVDHGLKMKSLKRHLFLADDAAGLIEIHGEPTMDARMVKINNRGAKIPVMAYRPIFNKWWVELRVRYNAALYTAEEILNLISETGISVGWGENRPEKGGANGTWVFKPTKTKVQVTAE